MRFIIFILFLPVVAFSQIKVDEWAQKEDSFFSIEYPVSWEYNESGVLGTTFFIFSPIENSHDLFRENVNLLIQNFGEKKYTLAEYTTLSEQGIKLYIEKSKLLESMDILKAGVTFHKVIYTGIQNKKLLKFEQYYFVKNNKAYVLTFTATKKSFKSYQSIAEKVLDSFVLK